MKMEVYVTEAGLDTAINDDTEAGIFNSSCIAVHGDTDGVIPA